MSITVNTNVQSLFAQRALSKNTLNLQKSVEKLSTGSKINKAADDAAGLGISEKLTAQIRGLEKAQQNVGDGISMVQTAEGSLSIVHDNLQRIRELVVQSQNGTNGDDERDSIQAEINKRVDTIDKVADATEFNSIKLLNGGNDPIKLQVGANDGEQVEIALETMNVDISSTADGTIGQDSDFALEDLYVGGKLQADGTTGTAGAATADALKNLTTMIKNVSRMRSDLGATQNSLESRSEFLGVSIENNSSARSRCS
jgi:flagellin